MKLNSAPTNIPVLPRQLTVLQPTESAARQSGVATLERPQPVVTDSYRAEPRVAAKQPRWVVFSSTFLSIFLAEIGDKTQLSTLLMSAESQSPGVVFLGAAAALITTSLLGVLLGQWLANRLTPKTLNTAAGISLLLVSAMLLWDVMQF